GTKFLVSGSSGLIGSALVPCLTTGGHEVVRLVRPESAKPRHPARRREERRVEWSPREPFPEERLAELEGFDYVVHLAGKGIADARWTKRNKRLIMESRREGTRHLCEALAKLDRKPKA